MNDARWVFEQVTGGVVLVLPELRDFVIAGLPQVPPSYVVTVTPDGTYCLALTAELADETEVYADATRRIEEHRAGQAQWRDVDGRMSYVAVARIAMDDPFA